MDIIDEILQLLIDQGRGIEINTAGWKYGLGHPNPHEKILTRYLELGRRNTIDRFGRPRSKNI